LSESTKALLEDFEKYGQEGLYTLKPGYGERPQSIKDLNLRDEQFNMAMEISKPRTKDDIKIVKSFLEEYLSDGKTKNSFR
jgi:hypothetical protein